MKTNNYYLIIPICIMLLLIQSCVHRVIYTYCDQFQNKDSLIQCILTNYDSEALCGLACCYEDSNAVFYGYLISDSTDNLGWYSGVGCDNDTVALFYNTKGLAMGCYSNSNHIVQQTIIFPDSVSDMLDETYDLSWLGVSVWDKSKFAKEYNNLDSLYNETLTTLDIESYNKLRRLVSTPNRHIIILTDGTEVIEKMFTDTLLPISIKIANKTHYPVACYDVYSIMIAGTRVPDEEFQFAYNYLCVAADSMYYPAVFLKACLCLTGAYFPQDTILGKKLLEQCHGTTSVPFWQQYYKPVVYQHLLQQ